MSVIALYYSLLLFIDLDLYSFIKAQLKLKEKKP